MKKFTWSETRVAGGRRAGHLAAPPASAGPFQGIQKRDQMGKLSDGVAGYYRDALVVAYCVPEG
ncbi:glycosyl hydrolase, partial [Pseudomonas sp. FW306-2-11BA]|uniref:glycosyl hydrolase n=1 Tax=Pseudomonas sp. FW306-2-11BA TaxID=2070662 RepID=UPI002114DDA8